MSVGPGAGENVPPQSALTPDFVFKIARLGDAFGVLPTPKVLIIKYLLQLLMIWLYLLSGENHSDDLQLSRVFHCIQDIVEGMMG